MIRFNDWTFDRKTMTVTHGDRSHAFVDRPDALVRRFRINRRYATMEHIVLSGERATRDSLWELLYSDHEDGGPIGGTKIFDVMFSQMRPALKTLGVRLVQDKRAGVRYLSLRHVV